MESRQADMRELRSLSEFEARQQSDGSWKIGGYASTFNDPYQVHDRFGTFSETILPGTWDKTLSERGHKIQLLASHDGLPYASTRSKSLKLSTDEHGLGWEAKLSADSPRAQDLGVGIRDGYIDEMSVGMRVPASGDSWSDDQSERHISEASLLEISVVARGANPNTEATMREAELLAEIRSLRAAAGLPLNLDSNGVDPTERVDIDALASMRGAIEAMGASLAVLVTAVESMNIAEQQKANETHGMAQNGVSLTDLAELRASLSERQFRIPISQELSQLLMLRR